MDLLDRMLGHDHWANTRTLQYASGLSDAQLDQEFDLGHKTLRETLAHMIFNVHYWSTEMAGEKVTGERGGRYSIDELMNYHERFSAAFSEVARRARDEQRLDNTFIDHAGY